MKSIYITVPSERSSLNGYCQMNCRSPTMAFFMRRVVWGDSQGTAQMIRLVTKWASRAHLAVSSCWASFIWNKQHRPDIKTTPPLYICSQSCDDTMMEITFCWCGHTSNIVVSGVRIFPVYPSPHDIELLAKEENYIVVAMAWRYLGVRKPCV